MSDHLDFDHLIPCNSTLSALVEQAFQLNTPHEDLDYNTAFAAGYCQFSTNSTLAAEAKDIWVKASSYGYTPSSGFAIFAMVAFGIAALVHLYQLYRSRRWSYIVVLLGLALQIFGWYERYAASSDIQVGYVEQLATLTIAPTFFSAALYTLFSALTAHQDPSLLPRFKPRTYLWLFVSIDFITLVIQAAGGAIAAITDDNDTFKMGCNIMLAGIVLQLVTTVVFLVVFTIYYHHLRQERRGVLSLREGSGVVFWGIVLIAALIIVRGCYRTAELSEGLFGRLAREQIALILADCIPMILVAYLLALTHPLHTLSSPSPSSPFSSASSSESRYVRAASTTHGRAAAMGTYGSREKVEGTELGIVERV